MAQITINEGLAWLKTLKKRHEELLALRNDNAHRERRFYGASADVPPRSAKSPFHSPRLCNPKFKALHCVCAVRPPASLCQQPGG